MITRVLGNAIREAAREFPAISLTGPRQSGKTTLIKSIFQDYEYVSLENKDHRAFATADPRGFLARYHQRVVFDEVQRTPDLFSYLQTLVDEDDQPGRFILTGSQNFLLLENISQSLAGRCAILRLLPLSWAELTGKTPWSWTGGNPPSGSPPPPGTEELMEVMFTGFYPRIHGKGISPTPWLSSYYQTYIEKDVRNVLKIGDLETFSRFVQLCAGRNGQILNLASLATDTGISPATASRWLSVLEASFIVMLLRPHHRNFNKRLVKNPKLYFVDTGLLCYLLHIRSPRELLQHPWRGAIFESMVITDIAKNYHNRGERPPLYFWRDSHGHEIDLLMERGISLVPVEIKSSQTVADHFFEGLRYWQSLNKADPASPFLIYGGDQSMTIQNVKVMSWRDL